MFRFCLALTVAGLLAQPGLAHYNMLLPDTSMAKKGDKVGFIYQFGHPFEHELFDAPKPTKVEVRLPDGKMVDLTAKLEKFKKPGGADGKEVTAFRFDFTPEQRGDHWFVLTTPPIWMEESKEFYQDIVQVCLHVQTQNGWDRLPGAFNAGDLYFIPFTRPYGLLPGMAFQAQLFPSPAAPVFNGRIVAHLVEIERYNSQKAKEIPPDEFVTFTVRTARDGVFTCTLSEPGWWCMTGQRNFQKGVDRKEEERPLRERVTLWVHVATKTVSK